MQLQVVHLIVGHVEHDIYYCIIRDKFATCIQHKTTVAVAWKVTDFPILQVFFPHLKQCPSGVKSSCLFGSFYGDHTILDSDAIAFLAIALIFYFFKDNALGSFLIACCQFKASTFKVCLIEFYFLSKSRIPH